MNQSPIILGIGPKPRAGLLIASMGLFLSGCSQWIAIDSKDINENGIQVRIVHYEEERPLVPAPNSYYVFESRRGEQEWREFMRFRHDDPIPIPVDQVQVFSPGKASVFIGWQLGVTIDGGETWSIWNASKDLPGWQCCNYKLIERVSIHPDGSGEMHLRSIPGRGEVPLLTTNDFGVHWASPGVSRTDTK
jgi:hypothetical protein